MKFPICTWWCLPAWFLTAVLPPVALAMLQTPRDSERAASQDDDDALLEAEGGEIFGETAVLVAELTRRSMPELVEFLLKDQHPACRIHVARAWFRAAGESQDSAERADMAQAATREFKNLIAREESPAWLDDDRRRVIAVQCRMEWAAMILQLQCAAELDRFELTSGLQFERADLSARLRHAVELYAQAKQMLDVMEIGLRTQEERYLLLGLSEKITRLIEEHRNGSAWAELYLGTISETTSADRGALLLNALTRFDSIAEAARQPATRHHALIGAGIALRESGQWREARAAFTRVIDSTAPIAVTSRASFELARALIIGREFDEARRVLKVLAQIDPARFRGTDQGALFYSRVAPLIAVYSLIRQLQQPDCKPELRDKLRDQAIDELDAIARRDPTLQAAVRVYLHHLPGSGADHSEMSATQLSMAAQELMAKQKFSLAIAPLQALLDRKPAAEVRDQAMFNLAVCHFESGSPREAGELFLSLAESASHEVAARAAEHALKIWSKSAAESRQVQDYRMLARAAALLNAKLPEKAAALDAAWIAALALHESGEYEQAVEAYQRIPSGSPHELNARRNAAVCLEHFVRSAPAHRDRAPLLRRAAGAWMEAAGAFERTASTDPASHQARLAAAGILVSAEVADYTAALAALEPLGDAPQAMILRFRCLRGMGRPDDARQILHQYIETTRSSTADPALLQWTRQLRQEMTDLKHAGRLTQLRETAADAVLILELLLEWLPGQPRYAEYVPAVRIALVETLRDAGQEADASHRVEKFLALEPDNGSLIYLAASLAQGRSDSGDAASAQVAEAMWARLLEDSTLREARPAVYWEARYQWLRHQLRHGRAAEVVRGITTEKAWYPDLGGPPWQARLLELAEEARDAASALP